MLTHGILHPVLKHKFRVIFPTINNLNEDLGIMVTQQVILCSIDIVKKTFYLELRQPIIQGLISSINHMKEPAKLWIDLFHGSKIPTRLVLSNCKMISHNFELNYSKSNVAKHCLTFSFEYLNEDLSEDNSKPSKSDNIGMTPQEAIKKISKKRKTTKKKAN